MSTVIPAYLSCRDRIVFTLPNKVIADGEAELIEYSFARRQFSMSGAVDFSMRNTHLFWV